MAVPECFVKGGNTKFYSSPHEPQMLAAVAIGHDWSSIEHATNISSKNRSHTKVMEVVATFMDRTKAG